MVGIECDLRNLAINRDLPDNLGLNRVTLYFKLYMLNMLLVGRVELNSY